MFNVPRPIYAVIAALVVAWLLPQVVDYLLNEPSPSVHAAAADESGTLRFAKGR